MDPSYCVWSALQATLAFFAGWNFRGHCKVEFDLDAAPVERRGVLARIARSLSA